ncbi:MAG: CBS domain-containing protein [Firmicutes bacterium]|nr:CBS domain-containing protein [Bacillota bacterium]
MTIILTHNHADFDALAAQVAAARLYPGSYALAPEQMQPEVARFVENYGSQLPLRRATEMEGYPGADVIVLVDCRRRSSLGIWLPLVDQAQEVHIYDHHEQAPDDIEGDEIRVEPVGAATTLLVEEIRRRRIPLSEVESSLMLLGIYRDTASLSSDATTPRDAAAVAYLWELGVKPALIREYLSSSPAAGAESLFTGLIRGSELYEICGRTILLATVSAAEFAGGARALAWRLQEIEEADLAIVLAEMAEGRISLSARTTADDLDLLLLLGPLDAGGSGQMVHAEIKGEELGALKKRLLELLERYLPPPAVALQVASTPVAAVDAVQTVTEVKEYLDGEGYSSCPVLEEGKVAGLISRKEIEKALRSGLGQAAVRGLMRRQPVTVGPQVPFTALRRAFVEAKTEHIIVVDEAGQPLGMVTPIDILRYLYRRDRRLPSPAHKGSLLQRESRPEAAEADNLGPLLQEKLPPRWLGYLLLIGQRAEIMGLQVYLVGGVIRDLLLDAELAKDLDIVVLSDAVKFAREMAKLLGGKLKVFEQFGTASLFLEEGLRLDFATARREVYAAPAALPQVEGTEDLKSDLFRRDFTINTLACSLLPGSFGDLHDFFNGREDLHRGLIRTLYNLSFVDDPLRLLRAVRFEQRFAFRIEENTLSLMEKAVRGRVLDKVSRQRLAREVSLIYDEPDPVAVLMRLHELGLLEQVYPRLAPGGETWARLKCIREALAWAEQRPWDSPPDKELVYLSGLLLEMAPQDQLATLRLLGLSRERAGTVLQGCREVPPLLEELSGAEGGNPRPSVLVEKLDPLRREALLLLYALAGSKTLQDHIRVYLESLQYVRPRLRGGALKELGLQPGPLYGEILRRLRRAVLDGEVRSYEEELVFVKSYLERREGE